MNRPTRTWRAWRQGVSCSLAGDVTCSHFPLDFQDLIDGEPMLLGLSVLHIHGCTNTREHVKLFSALVMLLLRDRRGSLCDKAEQRKLRYRRKSLWDSPRQPQKEQLILAKGRIRPGIQRVGNLWTH